MCEQFVILIYYPSQGALQKKIVGDKNFHELVEQVKDSFGSEKNDIITIWSVNKLSG
jgi:hypothetical protein